MKIGRRIIVVVNYLMIGCFLFAAAVQYNDPDWFLWMAVYGGAALSGILWLVTDRGKRIAPLVTLVISLAGIILIIPDILNQGLFSPEVVDQFKMVNMEVEKSREFGGLLIVAIWMAVLSFVQPSAST